MNLLENKFDPVVKTSFDFACLHGSNDAKLFRDSSEVSEQLKNISPHRVASLVKIYKNVNLLISRKSPSKNEDRTQIGLEKAPRPRDQFRWTRR